MNKIFAILIYFSFSTNFPVFAFAQSDTSNFIYKNSIYGELLGNGVIWSLNYERVLIEKDVFVLTGRVGAGTSNLYRQTNAWFFPFSSSILLGKSSSRLECVFGYTLAKGTFKYHAGTKDPNHFLKNYYEHFIFLPSLGYRFQKNHFQFRTFAGLIFNANFSTFYYPLFPTVGLSLGYSFGKPLNN